MIDSSSNKEPSRFETRFTPQSISAFGRDILKFDDHFKHELGLRILNPKSRLLFFVAAGGAVSIKQAVSDSDLSYRSFYQMLGKLKASDLITIIGSPHDGRAKQIILGQGFYGVSNGE